MAFVLRHESGECLGVTVDGRIDLVACEKASRYDSREQVEKCQRIFGRDLEIVEVAKLIDPLDVMADVVKALAAIGPEGITATLEYPGYISVWAEDLGRPGMYWAFGTANHGRWEGQLYDQFDDPSDIAMVLVTKVAASETDPKVIASAIWDALNYPEDYTG